MAVSYKNYRKGYIVNRIKRAIVIAMFSLLIISLHITAYASTVMPRYTYVDNITATLAIDTTWGIASCQGSLLAHDNMPLELVVKLQKYVNGQWETLKTWSVEDSWGTRVSGYYAIDRGFDYRVYAVGYVYDSAGDVLEIVRMLQQQHY